MINIIFILQGRLARVWFITGELERVNILFLFFRIIGLLLGSKRCNIIGIFQDAGGQGIGFMLGSLNVNWALTSEACLKGLSKTASGEVVTFRGR